MLREAVRRRLAPGAGRLQRRPGTRAAGDEALRHRGLLGAHGTIEVPAEGNARVRAADPRGDDRRPEPGAVRLRARGRRADRVRQGPGDRARSTCAGSRNGPAASVDEIQALNPELRRWTTPIKYPDYELKVPAGTGEQFRARLASAPADDLNSLKWHTVRSGESLATIARKLRVSKSSSRRPTTCLRRLASAPARS